MEIETVIKDTNEYHLSSDVRLFYIFISKTILSILSTIIFLIFNENCLCNGLSHFIIINAVSIMLLTWYCFFDIRLVKKVITNINDVTKMNIKYNVLIYILLICELTICLTFTGFFVRSLIFLFGFCVFVGYSYIEYYFFVKFE